jgi:hypothetical protein
MIWPPLINVDFIEAANESDKAREKARISLAPSLVE